MGNNNISSTDSSKKMSILLIGLCFLVYAATYLGRLNYTAVLAEIINSGVVTKGEAGGIGTGFFLAYGIGQLLSGYLGDKLPPKWMVFGGLLMSAILNAGMWAVAKPWLMVVLWSANGIAQAFIWSPLLKTVVEYLDVDSRKKASIFLNCSVPVGTVIAYGMTAYIVSTGSWRTVFLTAFIILAVVAVLWIISMTALDSGFKRIGRIYQNTQPVGADKGERFSIIRMLAESGLLFVMTALMVQGALKDGVTAWIPVYIAETYSVSTSAAIFSTMLIPLANLVGIVLASLVDRFIGKGELRTAGIFFGFCTAVLFVLWITSGKSIVIAFCMLAAGTTAMMAVNTMLVAVVPARFGKLGKTSLISGILNSSVYIGSAASTYGIGAVSANWGWSPTILIWIFAAAAGVLCCFYTIKKWKLFRKKYDL